MVPNPGGQNADAGELLYTYYYKDIDAADDDLCEEYDFLGKTSPNDKVTFDVSAMYGDGLPLFDDDTSAPIIVGSTLELTVGTS